MLTTTVAGCSGDGENLDESGSSGDSTSGSSGGENDDNDAPTETATKAETETSTATPEPEPAAEIIEHSAYEEEFESGVRGVVQNNTEETIPYLEIEVRFYDENGSRIGDNFTNVEDLGPGRRWEWKVMFLGDGSFAEYDLTLTDKAL